MTRARKQLVDLDTTPYYHCICRCVRRAFLCGEDHLTGKSYEHRKLWVVERLAKLSSVFMIDIAAYAVMSNHYHIVLRIDRDSADKLTEEQVIERWKRLFSLPTIVQRYQKGLCTESEAKVAKEIIAEWRKRMIDLSWYMRCLNEYLARKANKEDNCKGHFWESRFKSQALLDDAAVLTCMSYVDLNPVRAGIAETPELSDYTSIQQRISAINQVPEQETKPVSEAQFPTLMPLVKQNQDAHDNAIGYLEADYLELVDWAGRVIVDGKRGAIPENLPPILERLNIDPKMYLTMVGQQAKQRVEIPSAIGTVKNLQNYARRLGKKFVRNMSVVVPLYKIT